MGFIPKITCRRCKREYSGIHSRCPHCGTKKVKQSERTPVTTTGVQQGTAANSRANANAKWQMIFGLILVAAVIIAVIVLISLSISGDPGEEAELPDSTPSAPVATMTPTPPPPTPTPTASVSSITISYFNEAKTEFTANVGSQVQLTATPYPVDANAVVSWRSTDEEIITVDSTGLVTAVGSGIAYVIASCGGAEAECMVWVP